MLFDIFINLITPNSVPSNSGRAVKCVACICIFDALQRPYHDTHAPSGINRCIYCGSIECASSEKEIAIVHEICIPIKCVPFRIPFAEQHVLAPLRSKRSESMH